VRVIGLCGAAGAGKDTVASIIMDEFVGGEGSRAVKRQGFADALKLSAARLFFPDCDTEQAIEFCNELKLAGSVRVDLPGGLSGSQRITGRQFLQRYGTEAHRGVFGEDFWLDAVLPLEAVDVHQFGDGSTYRIAGPCARDDCDLLLIPDVRFENEAIRVADCGGEIWEVVRPGVDGVEAHASEAGIRGDLVTRTVHNGGSLADLRLTVLNTLDRAHWGHTRDLAGT
jgi:hypothetical protein